MILKSFEINKIDEKRNKFVLFYGKNNGAKIDAIDELIKKSLHKNFLTFDENQILKNTASFYDSILSSSLFDEKQNVIINRATDKITEIYEYLLEKNIEKILVIANANLLDKKSKLRSLFEKNKEMIIVPFYEDSYSVLNKICNTFIKEKKISISQSNINLIINKCDGDRLNLKNELNKIEYYSKQGKKISSEVLGKLTNLIENHSINQLVDNCLAKNKKKTLDILNENNYNNDDSVLITRTYLNKSKKTLKLLIDYKNNKNIDLTLSNAKPPIFWKDKEITKQQLILWEVKSLKELIYKLSELELNIKKNVNNSLNIVMNFILEQTSKKN